METLFKRVYLNGDPERLPKESKRCYFHKKGVYDVYLHWSNDILKYHKLEDFDWYLSPVTREEIITILQKYVDFSMYKAEKELFEKIADEIIGGNGK